MEYKEQNAYDTHSSHSSPSNTPEELRDFIPSETVVTRVRSRRLPVNVWRAAYGRIQAPTVSVCRGLHTEELILTCEVPNASAGTKPTR